MSFFPSPVPSETYQSATCPRYGYHPPPLTPKLSQQHDDEWTVASTTRDQDRPTLQASAWLPEGPRGLGLLPFQAMSDQTFHEDFTMFEHTSTDIHSPWMTEFAASDPPSMNAGPLRKDSGNESCDPYSTLLPRAAWDLRPPGSVTAYDTSPSRSDYSPSSRPSAISSPYTRSEGYIRAIGSPQIKIEEPQIPFPQGIHPMPDHSSLEQTLLVNPSDLMHQSPIPIEERLRTYLAPSSSSDVGEYKSPIARPNHRKASSCENFRTEIFQSRKKRGHTRKENATCSCKICGKLFQRTYNLKAHLEIHDTNRAQPYECQYGGCDKRFVRRTDLVRHEKSVSLFTRIY